MRNDKFNPLLLVLYIATISLLTSNTLATNLTASVTITLPPHECSLAVDGSFDFGIINEIMVDHTSLVTINATCSNNANYSIKLDKIDGENYYFLESNDNPGCKVTFNIYRDSIHTDYIPAGSNLGSYIGNGNPQQYNVYAKTSGNMRPGGAYLFSDFIGEYSSTIPVVLSINN